MPDGLIVPAIALNKEDFPAPLEPTTVTISDSPTDIEIFFHDMNRSIPYIDIFNFKHSIPQNCFQIQDKLQGLFYHFLIEKWYHIFLSKIHN